MCAGTGVQELFRHFVCAGINCSSICVCRNCSSILCVQELFRHFMCAGIVPALCAGIVPAFCVCRNCSSILCVQELFWHFGAAVCVHRNCSVAVCAGNILAIDQQEPISYCILQVDQSNFTYIPVLGVLSLNIPLQFCGKLYTLSALL